MKQILIACILLFNSFLLFSQETELVNRKIGDSFYEGNEEYYVLKTNKKIKHGTYIKYVQGLTTFILETGLYDNGEKTGVWQYYYPGSFYFLNDKKSNGLQETGQYIKGKKNGPWISYYSDSLNNQTATQTSVSGQKLDSVVLEIQQKNLRIKKQCLYADDKEIGTTEVYDYDGKLMQIYSYTDSTLLYDNSLTGDYKLNRKPVFIGGDPVFKDLLFDNFSIPWNQLNQVTDSCAITIGFTINEKGNVINPKKISEKSFNEDNSLRKEFIRMVLLSDKKWAPALKNGIPTAAFYRINFKFIIDNPNHKRYFYIEPLE